MIFLLEELWQEDYDDVYINESNVITTKISDKRDEDALASAVYKKSYEKIGWDYLSIATYEKNDKKYNDSSKAYAMGFLEGTLTNERIYSFTL